MRILERPVLRLEGKSLAVSHTYQESQRSTQAEARIISAREATPRERQQYEREPR